MTAPTFELFRCEPYNVRMTQSGCGKRYKEAGRVAATSIAGIGLNYCRGCPVGLAHAKGKPIDVSLAAVEARPSAPAEGPILERNPLPLRTCKCGAEFRPRTRRYSLCGPKCPARADRPDRPRVKQRMIDRVCVGCGEGFQVSNVPYSNQKFCEPDCGERYRMKLRRKGAA